LIANSWKAARRLWRRYRNTWGLQNPSLVHADYASTFIFFSAVLVIVFQRENLPTLSLQFLVFLAALTLVIFGWFGTSYYWIAGKAGENISTIDLYSLSEDPIEDPEQDLLGREKFVDDFYSEITSIASDNSFVFGLYGGWGEGKSSVINLLMTKLRSDGSYLAVSIDPWHYKGEDSILTGFYSEIEKAVTQHFIAPGFARTLAKYRSVISPKISAGIDLNFGFQGESLEQTKQRVENYIARLGKRVVIFVDDVDRLQPNEVSLILKLVRLNTRLKGTIFVLSFDYRATTKKLDSIAGENGSDYIAKIVQKPIKLPKIEQEHLDRFVLMSDHQIPQHRLESLQPISTTIDTVSVAGLVQEVADGSIGIAAHEAGVELQTSVRFESPEKATQAAGLHLEPGEWVYVEGKWQKGEVVIGDHQGRIKRLRLSWIDRILTSLLEKDKIDTEEIKQFDAAFVYAYRSKVSKLIRNLRDAKRYINSLSTSLPPIAAEVNIKDFCLLEFLKVFEGRLYDDIFENWWFYVDQRMEGDYWVSPLLSLVRDEAKKSQMRIEHVAAYMNENAIDPIRQEVLTEILKELFPASMKGLLLRFGDASDRRTKRISTTAFIKYFTLRVPSSELSDQYLTTLLKKWDDANAPEEEIANVLLELQESQRLMAFLTKTLRVGMTDVSPVVAMTLVRVIYKNIDRLSKEGREDLWRSERDKAESLLLWLINDRVSAKRDLLLEVVHETPSLPLAVGVVQSCQPGPGGELYALYDVAKSAELRKRVAARLQAHFIEGGKDIFTELPDPGDWGFVLYQWGTNWETLEDGTSQPVNDYVLSLLQNNPTRFAAFFAPRRRYLPSGRVILDVSDIDRVYDFSQFETLATGFVDDDSLTVEEREVIQLFIDSVRSRMATVQSEHVDME
jgi:hypothetical protein